MNCRLIKELKTYVVGNKLLLSGTPLQNNLDELWSLLNFLMPELFDDLDAFNSWFQMDAILEREGGQRIMEAEARNQIVSKMHAILKPFLLRRTKYDGILIPSMYISASSCISKWKHIYRRRRSTCCSPL